jgi:1-acyl-sn-glycerol-3-phosphate acyltransferase
MPGPSVTYRLAASTFFAIMRAQRWRFDVTGLDNVPERGGAVLTLNHTSYLDVFTVGRAPYLTTGRPIRILAKQSLFDAPLFGTVMRRAEHIPVRRGAGASALVDAVEALRRGELIAVPAEQTISPSFELLEFKTGAARMAMATGVPIVPSVSWGSHRFFTVGRWPRLAWRIPVSLRYGEPVRPAVDDDPAEVTAEVRRRTAVLLAEAQQAYPDGSPAGEWWVPARLGGGAPSIEEAERMLSGMRARWHTEAARSREERAPGVADAAS